MLFFVTDSNSFIRFQSRRKRHHLPVIIKNLFLRNHLCPQRSTDLAHATVLPLIESFQTQGVEHKVVAAVHKVHHPRCRSSGDNINFRGDLAAVRVQREIVDVVTKGVLEFAADCDEAEDDICSDFFRELVPR